MHRPTFRRARRSLALGVAMAAALALVGPLAQAGAAGGNEESFATLKVTAESVSLKAKGEDDFKPAADGDQLRAGDTVRTDATGKAEIEYGDDAYTRLDSDTTFKITKLSDDEGNRQVEGTIESGKTWNRTAALTESESFEQTGADATAAVEGTAFAIECETVDHCVFTGVVDDVSLTGADGVKKLLNPLDECDSSSGILCGDITQISADDLPQWILDNLILDIAEGYEFPFGGTIVVENGSVFFVPGDAASSTAPPLPGSAPTIGDPALDVDCTDCVSVASFSPDDEIVVSTLGVALFQVRIASNPSGLPVYVVFVGTLPTSGNTCTNSSGSCNNAQTDHAYDVATVFSFRGGNVEAAQQLLQFYVTNDSTLSDPEQASATEDVPVTVENPPCNYSEEVGASC